MSDCSIKQLMGSRWTAKLSTKTMAGTISMRRRLPPNVERNVVKGHVYLSYRVGKGPRIKLPRDPTSSEFKMAYAAAVAGEIAARPSTAKDALRSIGAVVTSYLNSGAFRSLGEGSKSGYRSRMDQI